MDDFKVTRLKLLAAASIALAGFAPAPAFAGHIFTSNMALPYGLTVQLDGGYLGPVSSLAGQQILTVNDGSSYNASGLYTLAAWCIDFPHHINIGGLAIDYTVLPLTDDHIGSTPGTSPTLSALQSEEIGGLVSYGNQHVAASPSNQLSAAVQAAIWNIEYGSHYAGSDVALGALISSLEALAPSLLSTSGLALNSFVGGSDTYDYQSLEFNLPEPMTMSVLGIGILGLALARRRIT